jgi:Flp pilus assembly protein TadD
MKARWSFGCFGWLLLAQSLACGSPSTPPKTSPGPIVTRQEPPLVYVVKPTDSAGKSGDTPGDSKVPPPPPEPGLARGNGQPGDSELAAGDLAYDQENYGQALEAYQRARKKNMKDPAPIVGMVRVKLAQADVPTDFKSAPGHPAVLKGISDLKHALLLDSNYVPARIELGQLYLIQGKSKQALDELKKASELGAKSAEAFSALGVALLATGSPQKALEALKKATELDATNPARFTNLGAVQLNQGNVQEAIQAFEKAKKLDPNNARALSDLGAAHLAAGDVGKALPNLKKAIELNPKKPSFHANLSYALALQGDLAGAEKEARKSVELDKNFGSGWINLGTALAKQKKYKEARKAFEQALKINPNDPRAKANMAELKQLESGKSKPLNARRISECREPWM